MGQKEVGGRERGKKGQRQVQFEPGLVVPIEEEAGSKVSTLLLMLVLLLLLGSRRRKIKRGRRGRIKRRSWVRDDNLIAQ